MTGTNKKWRAALDRLADAFVDDILNASDEDILAEFLESHGDPDRHAVEMREAFETSIIAANKRRLAAAKAGVVAARTGGTTTIAPADIADARRRLRAVLDAPNLPPQLTLAARKENELSDSDIAGMLDDLRELGVIPRDGDEDGKS